MMKFKRYFMWILCPIISMFIVGWLLYSYIAPPYKSRCTYLLVAYHLNLGVPTEVPGLSLLPWIHELPFVFSGGAPTSTYTGQSKSWYKSGHLAFNESYSNGLLHGKSTYYDWRPSRKNRIVSISEYNNGLAHGYTVHYTYHDSEEFEDRHYTYYYNGNLMFRLVTRVNAGITDLVEKPVFRLPIIPFPEMDMLEQVRIGRGVYYSHSLTESPMEFLLESSILSMMHDLYLDLHFDESNAFDILKGREFKRYPHAPKGEQTILELLKTRLAQIPLTITVGKYSYESNVVSASISPEEQVFKKPSSKRKDEHVISRTIEHEGVPLVSFLVDDTGNEHPYIHIDASEPETAYSHELLGILYYISRIDIYEPPAPVESATPSEPVQVNPHPDATTGS